MEDYILPFLTCLLWALAGVLFGVAIAERRRPAPRAHRIKISRHPDGYILLDVPLEQLLAYVDSGGPYDQVLWIRPERNFMAVQVVVEETPGGGAG